MPATPTEALGRGASLPKDPAAHNFSEYRCYLPGDRSRSTAVVSGFCVIRGSRPHWGRRPGVGALGRANAALAARNPFIDLF